MLFHEKITVALQVPFESEAVFEKRYNPTSRAPTHWDEHYYSGLTNDDTEVHTTDKRWKVGICQVSMAPRPPCHQKKKKPKKTVQYALVVVLARPRQCGLWHPGDQTQV